VIEGFWSEFGDSATESPAAAARVLRIDVVMTDKAPKAGAEGAEGQDQIRERVIKLAFNGDQSRYDEFIEELSKSTPDGVQVILRGSSITGHKWGSDEPFDHDGPGTSDLDVTFVGGDMVSLFSSFHIAGIHSVPLSDAHPYASTALGPLRQRLCEMTGRPVNLQATTSFVQYVRDIVMDQPYLILIDKPGE
jgi:hypothetical protein